MSVLYFSPVYRPALRVNRPLGVFNSAVRRIEPAYDIEKTGDRAYRITLAVPGFAIEDLAVSTQPNQLIVTGKQAKNIGDEHLRRGVVSRAFERRFTLGHTFEVSGASLENGLLTIDLAQRSKAAGRRTIGINGISPLRSLVERLRHVTASALGSMRRWIGRSRGEPA